MRRVFIVSLFNRCSGSSDGGRSVHASDQRFNALMKCSTDPAAHALSCVAVCRQAAERLHLALHTVGFDRKTQVQLHSGGDGAPFC